MLCSSAVHTQECAFLEGMPCSQSWQCRVALVQLEGGKEVRAHLMRAPRSMWLQPQNTSSVRWRLRVALEMPPLVITYSLLNRSGWP